MRSETHIVPEGIHSAPMNDFLVDKFALIPSRKGIKKAIKKGWIKVNQEIATSLTRLNSGDLVQVFVPEKQITPFEVDMPIIFEDDHLAVVSKPPGLTSSGNQWMNVSNALHFKLSKPKDSALFDPDIVHRLDFLTSGLMLAGKTRSARATLHQAFENKAVEKLYTAVVHGTCAVKVRINLDLGLQSAATTARSIMALEEGSSSFSWLLIQPHTGRTHQIRKHLASIGHPIVGDPLTNKDGMTKKGRGLFLHACGLRFAHPMTAETIEVRSPLPRKWTKVFPNLNNKVLNKVPFII